MFISNQMVFVINTNRRKKTKSRRKPKSMAGEAALPKQGGKEAALPDLALGGPMW